MTTDPTTDSARASQHILINNMTVSLHELGKLPTHSPDHQLKPWIAKRLLVPESAIESYTLKRRSLDARQKPNLNFIYQLECVVNGQHQVREEPNVTFILTADQQADQNSSLHQLKLRDDLPQQPIVIGSGPSGIMAAYLFALHGLKPIVIDRGFPIEKRHEDIEKFQSTRQLDTDSNYLNGEGGAGTYSDGKLYTRVKDRRMKFLLEAFVAARAPKHILWRHHPHIGSDILPHMAKRLREQIEAWGGTFRWGCTVDDIIITNNRCTGVVLSDGERIESAITCMGLGHSARDLLRTLITHNIDHKAKGYQLGCRIEHPQKIISLAQYGYRPPEHLLGAAEYNLVSRPPKHTGAQHTTTFCMCPGGEIIPATSDAGQLSTNGMSLYARSGNFANAGLIVNQAVDSSDNGLKAFDLLDEIEKRAFVEGGSDYACPAQTALSFMRGENNHKDVHSSYRLGIRDARLDQILPAETTKALQAALNFYERVIPGFLKKGNLIGVETRVSSPVRFERNPETLCSSLDGLYLMGEGAGYAGGIISAALDGLKIAECILTGVAVSR